MFIVAAKRTPFGAFGGKLKSFTATDLGVHAAKAALASIPSVKIDSVIFGNVLQTSTDAAYLARHIGLRAGLPIEVPALTVNRLCGSGFQSIINAIQEINSGDSEIVLTGGTESLSQAPFALRDVRWGTKYGANLSAEDTLLSSLTDQYPGCSKPSPMGITAENLGNQYNITRKMCDEFALSSQERCRNAQLKGHFSDEIAPIEVKIKEGKEMLDLDEHTRDTNIAALGKLPSVFIKDTGLVSAGNASGICDGAAAVVVASENAVKANNLKPLAKIISYHISGVDPQIMGIGPVPAIREALKKAKLELKDMSFIEVNEAFAAQYLAVEKELGLDRAITNSDGGAIAIGHPLGASGSRIMAHLTHKLHRNNGKYAIGSACIGGGQGIAIVIEKC